MTLSIPANAWVQTAYVTYNTPHTANPVYIAVLEQINPGPKFLGEILKTTVMHQSEHAIVCLGAFWDAFAPNCSTSYTFTNEGGSKQGVDSFAMGFTAKHVVLSGSVYTLNKPVDYMGARDLYASYIWKVSTAKTSGSFHTANGVPTGLLTCSEEEIANWTLVIPGMAAEGGGS